MKHSVGLFSVLIFTLVIINFPHMGATAQDLSNIIFSLAWSPDGSKIAVGKSGKIEILDAADLTLITTLMGSSGAVSAVDWSPDGSKLAGASFGSNGLAVWDILTGQIIAAQSIDSVEVKWHPDNISVATADTSINIGLWNASTGEDTLLFLQGSTLDWNPDGSKLVSARYNEAAIVVTDITTAETLFTISGDSFGVGDVDWSPDGTKIAAGGPDNTVKVWNAATGESLLTLEGHTDLISSVAWSPNNQNLASGSSDETVRFWDGETGELLRVVEAGGQVRAIAWSPDGSKLVYGGDDGVVRVVPSPQLQTPTPPVTSQNEAQTLRELLTYPTCQRTCFMGIEPGVTTQAELETILDQHQLEFTHASIASGHLILYTVVPSANSILADDKSVYIDVTADHVDLMTLFLEDVTAAQITSEYGAPDAIVGSGGGSNFIIYVAEGLVFATKSADTDSIGLVFLTPPGRDALRINSYLSDFAPCSGSVTVCGIPTATVTP